MQVIDLTCPGCGAPVNTSQKDCDFCHRPVIISSFNSISSMNTLELNKYANAYRKALSENPDNIELNTSIGMCYLKLKLYDKAIESFDKAVVDNFDNPETYFYAAVSVLKGRKAFLCQRTEIDKIEEYISAAIMIEPRGIFYYFLAYIKYDYFERKSFKTTPNYEDTFVQAQNANVSEMDKDYLFSLLGVEKPNCL